MMESDGRITATDMEASALDTAMLDEKRASDRGWPAQWPMSCLFD